MIRLDENPFAQVNAHQSVSKDGQPIVSVSRALLKLACNKDELAFVLAHEAAHQIANHIQKTNAARSSFNIAVSEKGFQLSILEPPNMQMLDLEADAIGTINHHTRSRV